MIDYVQRYQDLKNGFYSGKLTNEEERELQSATDSANWRLMVAERQRMELGPAIAALCLNLEFGRKGAIEDALIFILRHFQVRNTYGHP